MRQPLDNVTKYPAGAESPLCIFCRNRFSSPASGRTVLISVHIPKCGGSSFRRILADIYGPDAIVLNYNENAEVRGELIPAGTRCIHGHFPSTHYDRLFPGSDLVAWLRNPVERVVSNYQQFLRHPDPENPCSRELAARKLSLIEFAELELMQNEASRYFAGKPVSAFKFIGILERYQESLMVFGDALGVPLPAEFPRENVNPGRSTARYSIPDHVYERILSLNADDMATYELAAARLNVALWRATRTWPTNGSELTQPTQLSRCRT